MNTYVVVPLSILFSFCIALFAVGKAFQHHEKKKRQELQSLERATIDYFVKGLSVQESYSQPRVPEASAPSGPVPVHGVYRPYQVN